LAKIWEKKLGFATLVHRLYRQHVLSWLDLIAERRRIERRYCSSVIF